MSSISSLSDAVPPGTSGGAGVEPWLRVREVLDGWVAHRQVAGLQYLVMAAGEPVFEHHAGVADAGSGEPVGRDTQFNLYSLTKPLTSTLVCYLVQDGLDLDEPIARATGLPALDSFGSVRDTLLHRAGFPNPMPLRWIHGVAEDEEFDESAFVQRQIAAAARQGRVGPRYSNIGYLALGLAIERATGLGFRRAMRTGLIDRLSLRPGEFLGFTPGRKETWARGHLRRWGLLDICLGALTQRSDVVAGHAAGWVRLHRHHVNGSAYGGLVGNAHGLARFGMAMLVQGGPLPEELRHSLCAPQPGTGAARTLAWFCGELGGLHWLGHAGGGLGAYAELRLYPQIGTVSVLLTNRPGLRDSRDLDRLDAIWLRAQGRR